MIGIVVPAHNEEKLLAQCLRALQACAEHPGLQGERVEILAVLDDCTDRSHEVAATSGVHTLSVSHRNVGRARAAGATRMIGHGARWLAFTDADSEVSPDWLVTQLSLESDAVCGCVHVDDWLDHEVQVRQRYNAVYQDRDGHRHVHGANFGVSTESYLRAGGFPPLAVSEDVALVAALIERGARIAWSALPRVRTSARRDPRARGGFGDHLRSLAT